MVGLTQINMLYILVLLIPFLIFIVFLVRQNKRLLDEYVSYYRRIWKIADGNAVQMAKSHENELDVLISDDSIKVLEQDVSLLEETFGFDKSSVVSNTFTPKKKKLQVLGKRIKKLESKVSEQLSA